MYHQAERVEQGDVEALAAEHQTVVHTALRARQFQIVPYQVNLSLREHYLLAGNVLVHTGRYALQRFVDIGINVAQAAQRLHE